MEEKKVKEMEKRGGGECTGEGWEINVLDR